MGPSILPSAQLDKLKTRGWYLDDGILIGPSEVVAASLAHLKEKCASIGLQMNAQKTEILCARPQDWQARETGFNNIVPLEHLELLGLPCGNNEPALAAYLTKFAAGVVERTRLAQLVMDEDPHVGFLMVKMCCGFPAVNHLLRALGDRPELEEVDTATWAAARSLLNAPTNPDPQAREAEIDINDAMLQQPFRKGGLGLRSVRLHAPAAHIDGALSAAALHHYFGPLTRPMNEPSASPQCHDPRGANTTFQAALDQGSRAPGFSILADLAILKPEKVDRAKRQRDLSKCIDDDVFDRTIAPKMSDEAIARCGAAAGAHEHLCAPLTATFSPERDFWFSPIQFRTSLNLRMGLPVNMMEKRCACGKRVADVHGRHAVTCMGSGKRHPIHRAIVDAIAEGIKNAEATPCRETQPFLPDDSAQVDLEYRTGGMSYCLDAACTHPLTTANAIHKGRGAAAKAYESVKVKRYKSVPARHQSRLVFFVVDTFGGLGPSASNHCRVLARAIAHSTGLLSSTAGRVLKSAISCAVLRSAADAVYFPALTGAQLWSAKAWGMTEDVPDVNGERHQEEKTDATPVHTNGLTSRCDFSSQLADPDQFPSATPTQRTLFEDCKQTQE